MRIAIRKLIVLALALGLALAAPAWAEVFPSQAAAPEDVKWTPEELLARMTLQEKVGQLFVIRPEKLSFNASDQRVEGGKTQVTDTVRAAYARYPVGGFVLFSDNISDSAQLRQFLSDLRGLGTVAPILAIDEEGGTVARLANKSALGIDNVGNMLSIGKTGDVQRAYEAGATIGGYLSDYGFTLDFAPVADLSGGAIGNRAFGRDPELVSSMVSAFIDGLHARGVRSCIKHFPGHGTASGDTHKDFVVQNKTAAELMASDLVPFIGNLARTDVVMVAHISLPKLTSDDLPASLSRRIITDGLRNGMGFNGVVVTDSLEMGAITKHFKSAEAACRAFDAGVDLLLMPSSIISAFDGVVQAVEQGRISEARLDESVLRILRLKLG